MADNIDQISAAVIARLEADGIFDGLLAKVSPDVGAAFIENVLPMLEKALAPRVLTNGGNVTTLADGTKAWGGPSRFSIFNFKGGAVVHDKYDRNQVDVFGGGGADCMFNFLVSSCFASLAGFVEGQTFTALSGCTFKGYSTVAGAVLQAFTDFPSTTPAVIAVCSGTYAESIVTGLNQYIRILGTGRDSTIIGGKTGASVANTFAPANTGMRIWMSGVTLKTNHSTSGTASRGLYKAFEAWLWDCNLVGNVLSGAGEYAVETATADSFMSITNCHLSGPYGVKNAVDDGHSQIQFNRFTNTTLGCFVGEDSSVRNNWFDGVGIGVSIKDVGSDIDIAVNRFFNGTTGIALDTGEALNIQVYDNVFDAMTTFLDVSNAGTAPNSKIGDWDVYNNRGQCTTLIKFPTNGIKTNWAIHGNITTGALYSGATSGLWPGMMLWDNFDASGIGGSWWASRRPVGGSHYQKFTGGIYWVDVSQPFTLGVMACVIRFGDTDVSVAEQTAVATASTTNYFEINSAGTFSVNQTGFTKGTYHVLKVVTVGSAAYSSHSDVGGILYVQVGGDLRVKGQATIANLASTVVVTHGAGVTPVLQDIFITLGNNPTTQPGEVWVDTITSTQFTINCAVALTVGSLTVGWTVFL